MSLYVRFLGLGFWSFWGGGRGINLRSGAKQQILRNGAGGGCDGKAWGTPQEVEAICLLAICHLRGGVAQVGGRRGFGGYRPPHFSPET